MQTPSVSEDTKALVELAYRNEALVRTEWLVVGGAEYDRSAVDFRRILSELRPFWVNLCDEAQGAALCVELLASYPYNKASDPAAYIAAIESIIREFPHPLAARAVDSLTRESSYLPSRHEVLEACEKARKPLLIAWNTAAKRLYDLTGEVIRLPGRSSAGFVDSVLCEDVTQAAIDDAAAPALGGPDE